MEVLELVGCDFSSSPNRRKPIVIARGQLRGARVRVTALERFHSLDDFAHWLAEPRPWLGAFDFPFGLPRELVQTLGWPLQWQACVRQFAAMARADIRTTFAAFCAARPAGAKFAHRATDGPAGSSPSMKWVNPPVAYMLHAGVVRLLDAGVALPGLCTEQARAPQRIALEGYPGLLAREVLGRRSYKSDAPGGRTPERLIARKDLLTALEQGRTRLQLALQLSHAQRDALVDDARGDALDAVLCLLQAAWAQRQGAPRYGLPPEMDPLEGWILTA